MNHLLDERYRFLFHAYGYGVGGAPPAGYEKEFVGPPEILDLKTQIESRVLDRTRKFRSDALLFLLVNLDHMIFRPYFSALPGMGRVIEPLSVKSRELSDPLAMIERTLGIILDYVDYKAPEPVSGHDIMQAIDKAWPKLKDLFGWG